MNYVEAFAYLVIFSSCYDRFYLPNLLDYPFDEYTMITVIFGSIIYMALIQIAFLIAINLILYLLSGMIGRKLYFNDAITPLNFTILVTSVMVCTLLVFHYY